MESKSAASGSTSNETGRVVFPDAFELEKQVLILHDNQDFAEELRRLLGTDPRSGFGTALLKGYSVPRGISREITMSAILVCLDFSNRAALDMVEQVVAGSEGLPVVVLRTGDTDSFATALRYAGVADVIAYRHCTADALAPLVQRAIDGHILQINLRNRVRELEVANGRFLSLVADNADPILVIDTEGRIRFANVSAERIWGLSAHELLGEQLGIPILGDGVTEIELVRRDREQPAIVEIHANRTVWDGGSAYLATLRDTTERNRSERQLRIAKQTAERANEVRSQFLANMSHELRTPLNAILGFTELLSSGAEAAARPVREQDYLQHIRDASQHLLGLIDDLLDLSAAEGGRLRLDEQPVDLSALATDCLEHIRPRARDAGIGLCLRLPDRPRRMQLDRRLIGQLLANLLDNAVKFTPRGGTIALTLTHQPSGAVTLCVQDTGVGVAAEQIPRAFATFVRLDNVLAPQSKSGAGLGLALCKRIAELHGGTIKLKSALGRGTRVEVTLPASALLIDTSSALAPSGGQMQIAGRST